MQHLKLGMTSPIFPSGTPYIGAPRPTIVDLYEIGMQNADYMDSTRSHSLIQARPYH